MYLKIRVRSIEADHEDDALMQAVDTDFDEEWSLEADDKAFLYDFDIREAGEDFCEKCGGVDLDEFTHHNSCPDAA